MVFDVIGPHLILVDVLRRKLDGSKIVPALAQFVTGHECQFVSVEKQFVGAFVLDQLRQHNVVCKPFDAKRHGDKETRAVAAEIKLEGRQVWFPAEADWVAELQKELLGFPTGAHDDQVDALSMGCILAQKYGGKVEEEMTPEQQQEKAKKETEERFQRMLWAGAPW
jgi:predicted phage terminase large subunit-like protein